jgi:methionine--tRNA ligase beta chain
LIEDIRKAKDKIESLLEEFKFRDALFEVIDLSRKGNKYMQEKEPWIVAKKIASPNPSEGGALEPNDSKGFPEYQTADPMVYGLLKTFVSENRSNPTEAENILWQILRGKKLDSYKFRRQHIVGSYIADFVCISKKLIIEVDGLIHQIPENQLSDEERTAELKKLGFDVIRFTNAEVLNNTDSVINIILSTLTEKNAKETDTKNPPLEGREAQKSIDNCLHLCLQLTANLAILINPFLPTTAQKMIGMMKVVDKMLDWNNAGKIKLLSVGYSLREPHLLFRKIEDAEIVAQVKKLKEGASLNSSKEETLEPAKLEDAKKSSEAKHPPLPVPINSGEYKEEIQFDDFAKIDLKVGTILSAGKVEKADKLLKLQIDMGFEVRTIVSGIALHFKPEDIIGQQVVVVANLAPRKMRGIESNGMILMAEDKAGKLHFVNPATVVDNGSGVS